MFTQKVLTVGPDTIAVEPGGSLLLGPGALARVWRDGRWVESYDERELQKLGVEWEALKSAAQVAARSDPEFRAWLAQGRPTGGTRPGPGGWPAGAWGVQVGGEQFAVVPSRLGSIDLGPWRARVSLWSDGKWRSLAARYGLLVLGVDDGRATTPKADVAQVLAVLTEQAAQDQELAAALESSKRVKDRSDRGDVPRETIDDLNREIAQDEAGVLQEAVRGLCLRSGRELTCKVIGGEVRVKDSAGALVFSGRVLDPSSFVMGADLWQKVRGGSSSDDEHMIKMLRDAGLKGDSLYSLVAAAAAEVYAARRTGG